MAHLLCGLDQLVLLDSVLSVRILQGEAKELPVFNILDEASLDKAAKALDCIARGGQLALEL